jgi:general secretion pathway protein G
MQQSKSQSGFSLIEMLLVLGIIAVVGTLVFTNLIGRSEEGKIKEARAMVNKLSMQVQAYYLDTGMMPTRLEDLVQKPANAPNWKGPYIKEAELKDPWGQSFQFKAPGDQGREFDILSYGADKQAGGSDRGADIGNWQ